MKLTPDRIYISSTYLHLRTKKIRNVALLTITIFAVMVLVVSSSSARTYEETFQINGLKLGDKLSYFKAKFPGAVCGTAPTAGVINRKTLDDPDDSGWITCCVDDPQQLAAFSRFQVLSIDNNCRLAVVFRREHLQSLHYVVDVSSIQKILPEFIELYGPVHHTKTLPFGPDHTSEFATWWYGRDVLELNSATIYSEDLTDADYHKTGQHYAKVTYVDMWRN
jgi:hypothetical protein